MSDELELNDEWSRFNYRCLGCLIVTVIDAEEKEDYDSEEVLDYHVNMSIDVQAKSSLNSLTTNAAVSPVAVSTFACFQCTDCHTKAERDIETCPAGIRQCFVSSIFSSISSTCELFLPLDGEETRSE